MTGIIPMQRRDLITLLGGAAAAWPLAASAQQGSTAVIGYLSSGSPEPSAQLVAAFRKGLSETGYVEGRNLGIEFRWANNDNAKLAEFAADLVRRRVRVVFASGGIGALAAKGATTVIPIVFDTGGDAVQIGLVPSLSRPGGNITGIASMDVELAGKRLGLLHGFAPGASKVAALINPTIPDFGPAVAEVKAGAHAISRQVEFFEARGIEEIDTAFASLVQRGCDALLVISSALFTNRRVQIVTLAARHSLPAMYSGRSYCEVGGLMGYGPSSTDQIRQAGVYTGRILNGEKPADMPVIRPTRFDFIINGNCPGSAG
jgi:ABC-type uncharacterized transport system substrate-binding protein